MLWLREFDMGKTMLIIALLFFQAAFCQETVKKEIPFGNFESWVVRQIKESFVIGGKTVDVYAIAPSDTIKGAEPYRNAGGSPWASSNVMAKVAGVVKTSVTVFPEKRGKGYCVRMDTKLETCKVLGMVNITVLASGSIFLGETMEPIRGTSNPYGKINMGMPFTGRPKAVVFDYKAKISEDTLVTRATGSAPEKVKGRDKAEVFVFLQKRWEDKNGNIFSHRIASASERFAHSTDGWADGHRLELIYGDATKSGKYHDGMSFANGENAFYAMNSKGKMVPIQEVAWGEADETPTHIILMFSSGSLGAYMGSLGNSLWVDNVKLEY